MDIQTTTDVLFQIIGNLYIENRFLFQELTKAKDELDQLKQQEAQDKNEMKE